MAEPGVIALAAIALPVNVEMRLLVDATEVATAELAAASLVLSMANKPPDAAAAALAAVPALSNIAVRLALSPNATVSPLVVAVLMASTMPSTMKFENVDMDGGAAPAPVAAPCSAAAPMAIMLATIKALLLMFRASSKLMPEAASSVEAVAVLTVSMRVRSASAGRPSAEFTAVKALTLTSLILASFWASVIPAVDPIDDCTID